MSKIYINGHATRSVASKMPIHINGVQTYKPSEFQALETKRDDIIYNITGETYDTRILETYQGNRRITQYKKDISDYEFWYEELTFTSGALSLTATQNLIPTSVDINQTETLSRDWQIEFNASPLESGVTTGSTEMPVIGNYNGSGNGVIEFYFSASSPSHFYLYGSSLNDDSIGDVRGKDVIIKKENGYIYAFVDGVQVYSRAYTPSVHSSSNPLDIGSYRRNYLFSGKIKYIGFKWLS